MWQVVRELVKNPETYQIESSHLIELQINSLQFYNILNSSTDLFQASFR